MSRITHDMTLMFSVSAAAALSLSSAGCGSDNPTGNTGSASDTTELANYWRTYRPFRPSGGAASGGSLAASGGSTPASGGASSGGGGSTANSGGPGNPQNGGAPVDGTLASGGSAPTNGGNAPSAGGTVATGGISGSVPAVGGADAQPGSATSPDSGAYPGTVHYVATNGDDSWEGTSERPWATFAHAFKGMKGGDTLLIKDGAYNEPIRSYYGDGFPSGSPGAYTLIKAEHDWQVTVSGRMLIAPATQGYFQIEGIHFMQNPENIAAHHAKFIRNSFRGDLCQDNVTVVGVGTGSHDVLFEDCFAYGCGRYKFMAYGDQGVTTENIVFRRCVARHDYHDPDPGWGRQCATFTSYDAHNVLLQNCISIDSGDADSSRYGTLYGGVWFENKQTTGADNSGKIQDSIFLNLGGLAAINDPKDSGTRIIENSVIWGSQGGYLGAPLGNSASVLLNHMTIGSLWGSFQDQSYAWGTGAAMSSGFTSGRVTNSVISQCNSYGVANYTGSDYNVYHSNSADFGNSWAVPLPSAGSHDQFADPQVKYLARVENGSPRKGAASDGGDIGANIVRRRGVSGTLYGEPGYDQLTDEPLWPFPNEAVVKAKMSAWDGPNDARRGFCAEGQGLYGGPITLTSYVWEYLGNPCPADICKY